MILKVSNEEDDHFDLSITNYLELLKENERRATSVLQQSEEIINHIEHSKHNYFYLNTPRPNRQNRSKISVEECIYTDLFPVQRCFHVKYIGHSLIKGLNAQSYCRVLQSPRYREISILRTYISLRFLTKDLKSFLYKTNSRYITNLNFFISFSLEVRHIEKFVIRDSTVYSMFQGHTTLKGCPCEKLKKIF